MWYDIQFKRDARQAKIGYLCSVTLGWLCGLNQALSRSVGSVGTPGMLVMAQT